MHRTVRAKAEQRNKGSRAYSDQIWSYASAQELGGEG